MPSPATDASERDGVRAGNGQRRIRDADSDARVGDAGAVCGDSSDDGGCECSRDDDCDASQARAFCRDGRCVGCRDDIDCRNPERAHCVDGSCVQCTSREHCGTGHCRELLCAQCIVDEHCQESFAPRCEQGACAPDA
jgi:hypothetical protein